MVDDQHTDLEFPYEAANNQNVNEIIIIIIKKNEKNTNEREKCSNLYIY